ncbi:MAG: cbb3-type cytochrome c oxidase subunit I [Proteobacteria bacterium]|nr:cbb3-type cytochrome c oxidase subunit I [Pseudomonadota bacterium]
MDWFVRAFIKSSLAWFAAGVTLGLAMAVYPPLTVYRTAHLHINLLGFVAQMIYGVALHVVPRFFGQPLVYRRLAEAQYWLAQGGLLTLAAGFAMRVPGVPGATALIVVGALSSAAAAYCFIFNVWRTIDASPMRAVMGRGGREVPLRPQDK